LKQRDSEWFRGGKRKKKVQEHRPTDGTRTKGVTPDEQQSGKKSRGPMKRCMKIHLNVEFCIKIRVKKKKNCSSGEKHQSRKKKERTRGK